MNQQPIARFRAGEINCAIWENEIQVNGMAKTVLKANVSRRYKDRDGNWQSSQSFGRNEVLLAIHCLQQAVAKMIEEEQAQNGNGGNGNGRVEAEVVE